jgi:hypothetical protein
MKFFAWLNEQQQGPFDEETIQKMVSEGQITHETLLCPEGGDLDWTPAKELFPPDLSSTLAQETTTVSSAEHEDDGTRLEIRLTSGLELKIKAVRLYDEIVLAEINSKRAQALTSFQGVSTGLGSIGSIGWVLATSVVIGAVEGALSAAAASSGTNLLAEVIRTEQKLRNEGVFLPVGKIENVETPIPGLWRVPYKREARVQTGVNFWHEKQYGNREVPSAFIHSGDEFVVVQTDDGSICMIRWSAVERYVHLNLAS